MSSSSGNPCAPPSILKSAAFYGVIAVALTWPLILQFGSSVISHWDNDIEHSLWTAWWFGHALANPDAGLFRTELLHYPSGVDLQFADLNLAVLAPIWLLTSGLGLAAAYNLVSLASFVLSGLLMQRLAWRICGHGGASWFAGFAYAASPYWLAAVCNGWIYHAQTWVFPLVLLTILRAGRRDRIADFALIGASLGLVFHAQPYFFLYLAVLLPLLAAWYVPSLAARLCSRAGLLRVGVVIVVMALTVLPRAWPMIAASGAEMVAHSGPLNTSLVAQPSEMFWPSTASVEARLADSGYLVVYLGYVLLGVIILGYLAGRSRRAFLPWLVTAAAMLVLASGPFFGGEEGVRMPAYWLQQLPGFRFLTNHWRWSAAASVCLCTAAALGLAALCGRYKKVPWLPALIGALLVIEMMALFPFPLRKPLWPVRPSVAAQRLRDEEGVRVVLDVSPNPKLNQMAHEKAIVGGWLPRVPAAVDRSSRALVEEFHALPDNPAKLKFLAEHGIDAVLLGPTEGLVIESSAPGGFRRLVVDR